VGCSGTAVARPSGMALQWLGQLALVAAASAACLTSTPALAEPVSCEKEPGYVGGPYVANRQVAIAIFKAIADTIAPDQVRSHPVIAVEDEGDHWSVWRRQRSTAPAPKANESNCDDGRWRPGDVDKQVHWHGFGGGLLAVSCRRECLHRWRAPDSPLPVSCRWHRLFRVADGPTIRWGRASLRSARPRHRMRLGRKYWCRSR